MKEHLIIEEKIRLLEQEIKSLTLRMDELAGETRSLSDLSQEIRGLKLFLGRIHPEIREQLPEIVKKVAKHS